MEHNQPRVLAYQLAQTVPDDLLQDVSGGGAQRNLTTRTFKISGPSQDLDFEMDYHPE